MPSPRSSDVHQGPSRWIFLSAAEADFDELSVGLALSAAVRSEDALAAKIEERINALTTAQCTELLCFSTTAAHRVVPIAEQLSEGKLAHRRGLGATHESDATGGW
jgi:hypothetical protein